MTDLTPEALAELSNAATQGVWEIAAYYTGTGPDEKCHGLVEVEDFPIGIIDEEGATVDSLSPNLEFIVTLVNAYRTGQLVLVDDAARVRPRAAGSAPSCAPPRHRSRRRCRPADQHG